ncbi:transcriptional regulator GutM [Zobellella sp. An-6]|uniref:transcriptional regulator GutM n=1 Tax=Zobellella sp. An-6 TaxID=3400218 RepID=UPI004041B829
MSQTSLLIVIALIAWGLQILMGFLQVRAFNRMLQDIATKGKVKIGRTASRWRPRTIIVLAHDENGVIVDARVMKGISIFSRPKQISTLLNMQLPLSVEGVGGLNEAEREALACALSQKK